MMQVYVSFVQQINNFLVTVPLRPDVTSHPQHTILNVLALIPLLVLVAQEKSVPPPGIAVPADERATLEAGLAKLNEALKPIERHALAPDVLIFREAVRIALQYNEFFKPEEFAKARRLLDAGMERARALQQNQAPWTSATGLVVRGYVSEIDGSVQPYGLVIPATWNPQAKAKWRLDTWFHGRNDTLSEVNFLDERMRRAGEFTPRDTFVLHLYGRYCNANKFAGEADLFEALADVKRNYTIDENRILVRGFSMGGAATWHIGAHHAGLWAAVAPGAGFAEIAEYQKLNPDEFFDWERKLWRLYDATGYALNFFNTPLLAYSGELDRQKQAADIMARYLAKEGMELAHIIGPKTEHRYHPDSKVEIDQRLDSIAERGRDAHPAELRFATYTLRYNKMKWLTVDGMRRHWDEARVTATAENGVLTLSTQNVSALTLDFGPGHSPSKRPVVKIDGEIVAHTPGMKTDRSWRASFHRNAAGLWQIGAAAAGLRKRHGLQGPIDDAFLSRFLMVKPSGVAISAAVGERVDAERLRALREWRKMFRGEAREKADDAVNDADIASSNLVLWGDPKSNKVLARIADRLPVKWTADGRLEFRGTQYDGRTHMPVLIFPNPLNPSKYVVLNSGVTFREADYFTNSRQVPRLPDWAVVDVTTAADTKRPGRIAAAGFFDEVWQ
jgi:pimeloyl-ACP methyl ester carboxylesterase